ncbi:MAG: hypothetical protein ACFCAD_22855 [Pleurocapsa sp.]
MNPEQMLSNYFHPCSLFLAPCRVVYSLDKPLPCGARVWIEVLGVHLDLMAD